MLIGKSTHEVVERNTRIGIKIKSTMNLGSTPMRFGGQRSGNSSPKRNTTASRGDDN